jgi:hypothetical protein
MESTTGEKEKRILATTLKERLIEGKNTITYKELLQEEIPSFLRNFLQNRVQKYFHTDEPFQIKNSNRYDFNYPRIQEIIHELHQAFEEATMFTKEEITDIINRTVGLQFDLLVNTQKSLLKVFFKNKSERTQDEILQILNGLTDKRIYIQQLIKNIQEFDQFHIVEDDFNKLSENIQKEIYEKEFIEAFVSDVQAFLDFVSHIKGSDEKAVSKEILQLLLTERNLPDYFTAFETFSHNGEYIEISKISDIFQQYFDSKANEKKDDKVTLDESDDIEEFILTESKTEQVESAPAPEIITDDLDTETVSEKDVVTESTTEAVDEQKSKRKRHFPKIEFNETPQDAVIDRSTIEFQPTVKLCSLRDLIEDKDKTMIQRKIFKKDCIAYDGFIDRLDEINNWKEAKQTIDNELFFRSIQPFSREALLLSDLVFNRYFPKKN